MTVAIAVLCPDGIAVAADSRTTYGAAPLMRVLSDATHKVFAVGDCAVATFGWAFLQDRNIAGHFTEFVVTHGDLMQPVEVATELAAFMGDRIDQHIQQGNDPAPADDPLGFLVAGYESGTAQVVEVGLPSRSVEMTVSPPGGAVWRGQTDVIVRLIKGVDGSRLQQTLGVEELQELEPALAGLEYRIPFEVMNLQDAVDFAVLAIRTTIDVQRLTFGTQGNPGSWPGVGGPIEIAAVRPETGLEWVQSTRLQGERQAGLASDG